MNTPALLRLAGVAVVYALQRAEAAADRLARVDGRTVVVLGGRWSLAPDAWVARERLFDDAPGWWPRVKRDLARLHPNLGARRWFRRWAGGRWAEFALVVAPTPLVSMSDWWDAWATNDLPKHEDDTTRRWRPVESCPHGCWVTINNDPTPVWEVPYCECEVWP